MAIATITFKPKQVTKKITSDLAPRAYDVISNRFGLTDDAEQKTLEAIGDKYGITRERVRQIENAALNTIRKSDAFQAEQDSLSSLKEVISSLGSFVAEEDLLNHLSKDKCVQNHIHFHLVLGDDFKNHKEDDDFKNRWSVDDQISDQVHSALKNLYTSLNDEDIIPESELISKFVDNLKGVSDKYKNDEVAKRWLSISKGIDKNPLGEWGKADSPNVKTRGIKDYAFLVMRRHGSPMHFREVAKAIYDTFGKKTHVATCHNELIKDSRFVLVGRGLYALKEWGYTQGVVKDVIREILKKEGSMNKDDIIDRVMKERYLKKNTILVNLQNSKYFKKNKNGLYSAV
ncbi:MAG TPA: HTH domain-containing protein [Candidatus Paceibacterota bacterium]